MNEWGQMCKKKKKKRQVSRGFECGKPEARPVSEGSHLAPGLRVSKCLVVSGGNTGTHNSPVKHCTPV